MSTSKDMHGSMTKFVGRPLTRLREKKPIIGCRYSMLFSFVNYLVNNDKTRTDTIVSSIIDNPEIKKLMNGEFDLDNGVFMNEHNPISDVLSQGNGIYPFVLVMEGTDRKIYINHYFNIVSKDGKLYIYNSYGSDYVCIPYQEIEIMSDINCLNNFNNTRDPDVVHFFKTYFLPNGTTTVDPETKKFYFPLYGQQLEIEHFQSVNILGIFYLNNLNTLVNSFITENHLGGAKYRRKKNKTNRKKKTNKKKKTKTNKKKKTKRN
jgi:hypothetical protein